MRKSSLYFLFTVILLLMLLLCLGHAGYQQKARIPDLIKMKEMVRELGLSDLCLFTEARYTRHPSQADRFAPFQDHPFSLEHFPAGSMVKPPSGIRGFHE
jgi:hypothetical protein